MNQAEPASIKVHKTSGNTMEILWKDGHQSAYTFTYLRDACPCALCHDEREKSGRLPDQPTSAPTAALGALPMFKPALRPEVVSQVGNYAIRFDWNDGHKHGSFRQSSDGLQYDIEHHPPKE